MKRKENDDRRQEVEGKLIELSAMDQKELFAKYEVDEYGLDPVQASDRLEEYGRNIIDFGKDRASVQLTISTIAVIAVTLLIGFTGIASLFALPVMPIGYLIWLVGLMVVYTIFAQILKTLYIKRHKDWL